MSPPGISVERLDHLVLTVRSVEVTCAFYERVLGVEALSLPGGRRALRLGDQKVSLHEVGHELVPHALRPTPGSGDLCLVTRVPLEDAIAHVRSCGVDIVEGPVRRAGATGPLVSAYLRDPDGNLVELANEVTGPRRPG